jgi:uncharacterized damage-inducible protein DinB
VGTKVQAKKDEIIAELVGTRRKILDAASSLPPEKQAEVFLGVWSVKDLLAHLVGWDFTNLEAAKSVLAGKLPDFYSHYDRDWKTYNARLVAEHKRDDFAELLSSVEDSLQQLVNFLDTIPAEEFDKDRGVRYKRYKVTIARLLQAETTDEKTHHGQIEEFRQSKGDDRP